MGVPRGAQAGVLVTRLSSMLLAHQEFPFARLEAWARGEGDIELIERRKVKPFGIYFGALPLPIAELAGGFTH